MDTAKADFDRFSRFHSWYKHVSLEGEYYTVDRRQGQQQRHFDPVEDKEGYHWYLLRVRELEQDKKKVRMNYFLMRTWESGDADDANLVDPRRMRCQPRPLGQVFIARGGSVFKRDIDKINVLIAESYPHLPPFSMESPESLLAVMREEYDRMYQEFLAAAQEHLDSSAVISGIK